MTSKDYNSEEYKRKWGGHLYDKEDWAYWFNATQYCQAMDINASLPDDEDGDAKYWEWFDKFVEDEGIKRATFKRYIKKDAPLSSYWTSNKSSYYDYDDDDDWGTVKYVPISSYKSTYYNADTLRLLEALSAAQSVVDVISDDEKLLVQFLSDEESLGRLSYTIFKEDLPYNEHGTRQSGVSSIVKVSPNPFLDEPKIGLDLTSGLSLHEGSHGKWTNYKIRRIDQILSNNPNYNAGIVHFCSNMLEDYRIDKNLTREYPGFRDYLRVLYEWIWQTRASTSLPEDYSTIENRMKAAMISTLYPDKVREALTDPVFDAEIDWWQKWVKRYKGESNLEELLKEGHARILQNDPLPPKNPETPNFDMHGAGFEESDLDADEVAKITRAQEEDVGEADFGEGKLGGYYRGEFIQKKPVETDVSKSDMIRNDPLITRMREALTFRQAKPQRESNLLEDGELDEEQLDRVANKDYKIFKATSVTEDVPEVAVMLVVDASGSMSGPPMYTAMRISTIIVEALNKMRGASPIVVTYTSPELCRIYEPGDPISRLGIMKKSLAMGGTPTGPGIAWAGNKLRKEYEEKDRIMIVLSDGEPDVPEDVRIAVEKVRHDGTKVMQVAIGNIQESQQEHMFGKDNYIPLKNGRDPSSIIVPLTRWLRKQF